MKNFLMFSGVMSILSVGLSAGGSCYDGSCSQNRSYNNQHERYNSNYQQHGYRGSNDKRDGHSQDRYMNSSAQEDRRMDNRSGNGRDMQMNSQDDRQSESSNMNDSADRAMLGDRVRSAISSGWFSSGYENVQVEVSNGTVTLQGTVESEADKTKLEDRVKEVQGVKNVNNMVNISRERENSARSMEKPLSSSYMRSGGHIAMNDNQRGNHSDQQIRSNIDKELQGAWFESSYNTVKFDVNNGTVTITGIVESPDDMNEVESRLSEVPGVRLVRNNLTVSSDKRMQAGRVSDDAIKASVRNELENSWWGNYPNVNVEVNDGIVILSGTVESRDDLNDVQERLSNIPGVRVIRSRLILEGSSQ